MSRPTTRSGARLWRLLSQVSLLAFVVNGLRLRRRAAALAVLADAPEPDGGIRAVLDAEDGWRLATAPGVVVDDATLTAAVAHAERHELLVLDLVPGDLPVDRALETIRIVKAEGYREDPLRNGRGAYQATLIRASVLERMRDRPEPIDALDPVQYVKLMTDLKHYAATTSDIGVAPRLAAGPDDIEKRKSFLRSFFGPFAPAVPLIVGAELTSIVAGARKARWWGRAAAAAYSVQPEIAFNGTSIAPRDLHTRSLGRIPLDIVRLVRGTLSTWRSPHEVDIYEGQREIYDGLLANGLDAFFEPRRTTCPWCGSSELHELIRVKDRLQHKPGTFVLDECRSCQHVFQNPRLSIEGLDFYYRDFYDGIGEDRLDMIFGGGDGPYVSRVEMVKKHVDQPKRWLDVGAGHGHFCLIAREHLPDTVFDGLDMSESIEEAARRGWIDQSYRGLFPELASEVEGQYDIVSMHHYLEHTREPYDELDAAARALVPGGHFLIEVPNPDCRFGRLLKSFWLPWFQPQHQHFVSIDNLSRALEDRGFRIVAADLGETDFAVDFLGAAYFLVDGAAPVTILPWRPEPGPLARPKRILTYLAAMPMVVGAVGLDHAIQPFLKRRKGGNAYRVLAQKL